MHLVFLGEQYDAIARRLSVSSPSSLAGEELASWWSFGWLNRKGGEIGAHATALFKARDQRSLWTMQMMRRHERDIMFFTWLVSDQTPNTNQAECAEIPLAWYLAPCTQHELKLRLRDSVEHNPFETAKLQGQLITP